MSFRHNNDGDNKTRHFERLAQIDGVRVLIKVLHGNDCTTDGRPYRDSVHDTFDHPTHLGLNNATGYERLVVPEALGARMGVCPLRPMGLCVCRYRPVCCCCSRASMPTAMRYGNTHGYLPCPPGMTCTRCQSRTLQRPVCLSHGVIERAFVGLPDISTVPQRP